MKVGDKVKTIRDFSEVARFWGSRGYHYPKVGEVLTIIRIGSHPLEGHRMLYFDGYFNGISDISTKGPNFELEEGNDRT